MPNTSLGYPYPAGSDKLMDGDNAIQALAQAINDRSGVAAGGVVATPGAAAGSSSSVAVTFPAGRFPTAPQVIVTAQSNGPSVTYAACLGTTTTGITVYGGRTNAATSLNIFWLAVLI